MRPCPLCGSLDVMKVIYLGLPMRLCEQPECSCLHGFWAVVAGWLPVVSQDERGEPVWAVMAYDGWYPRALWVWLSWGAQ